MEQKDGNDELQNVRVAGHWINRPKVKAKRTQGRVIRENKLGLNKDITNHGK